MDLDQFKIILDLVILNLFYEVINVIIVPNEAITLLYFEFCLILHNEIKKQRYKMEDGPPIL